MSRRYIIIAGCGRLGSMLANRLSKAGNSVVVIDYNPESFRHLSADFSGYRIHMDAVEVAALRKAQIEKADCLLAATNRDNVNLMVAQMAKTVYQVPLVLARVYEPTYEFIYRELGIQVISPTQLSAEAFFEAMGAGERQ